MHELSIALNIIDVVQGVCKNEKVHTVKEVFIEVGVLSGIDTESLTTCLQIASRETIMNGAVIRIEHHQGTGYCSDCRHEFSMNDLLTPCPACHRMAKELREGQEMRIIEILAE